MDGGRGWSLEARGGGVSYRARIRGHEIARLAPRSQTTIFHGLPQVRAVFWARCEPAPGSLGRCGLCADACGPKSLAMMDGVAVLAFPETCGSEEHCIAVCRDDAIHMAWVPFLGDKGREKWRESHGSPVATPPTQY